MTAEIINLADLPARQHAPDRAAAFDPAPILTSRTSDAYWDLAHEYVLLRSLATAYRAQARQTEARAAKVGVPVTGIGDEAAGMMEQVERNLGVLAYEQALIARIQAWEDRS